MASTKSPNTPETWRSYLRVSVFLLAAISCGSPRYAHRSTHFGELCVASKDLMGSLRCCGSNISCMK